MKNQKNKIDKHKIVLHVCCAPCSTTALERLSDKYEIVAFWFNPNIQPFKEYEKRKEAFLKFAKNQGIKVITKEGEPELLEWLDETKGFEDEPEGGKRCEKCYKLRLRKTRDLAKNLGIDLFTTTLTVSPHKNSLKIFEIAKMLENEDSTFLQENFKKNDGYKKSIELSKKFELYRQNYCGCIYSKKN